MQENSWDVVVIGAGAAGLMAAARAAARGLRVLLLEKNRKAGVKILMSGGTRCNITQHTDNRGIIAAFGPQGKFLHSPLATFGVEETRAFFHEHGVPTKVEETGKVFPVSDRAADVLGALLDYLERSGATLALGEPVLDLQRTERGFSITTPTRTVLSAKVILTTGGQSYPGSGTTGDGYRYAQRLGHGLVPPRPALTPLTVEVPWVQELRGITLPDIGLSILEGDRTLIRKRGSLLFAHFGLSGPVALDVSRLVTGHPHPASLSVRIDLLPQIDDNQLDEMLRNESLTQAKKQLDVVLAQRIPRRLAEALLDQAGLPRDRKATGLSREHRRQLVQIHKHLPIPITGALGFAKAEVTAGGIPLNEVDSRTMASKRIPGLYFAGEVLDLDGPIGGYNFQAAWSTGRHAGEHV